MVWNGNPFTVKVLPDAACTYAFHGSDYDEPWTSVRH